MKRLVALPQGHWALYDLAADPFEKEDLAAEHPDIVGKMATHYEAWWKKVEVVLLERYAEAEIQRDNPKNPQ